VYGTWPASTLVTFKTWSAQQSVSAPAGVRPKRDGVLRGSGPFDPLRASDDRDSQPRPAFEGPVVTHERSARHQQRLHASFSPKRGPRGLVMRAAVGVPPSAGCSR